MRKHHPGAFQHVAAFEDSGPSQTTSLTGKFFAVEGGYAFHFFQCNTDSVLQIEKVVANEGDVR